MNKALLSLFVLLMPLLAAAPCQGAETAWWENDVYLRHELKLLIPDWERVWGKYMNTGNVLVQVLLDGQRLESYECAVYSSGGEQRECKSSFVDQGHGLGWCMLTIHGDGPEQMHFRVLYDTPDGGTAVADAAEGFAYEDNCMDLTGALLPGTDEIDPASVLTLHVASEAAGITGPLLLSSTPRSTAFDLQGRPVCPHAAGLQAVGERLRLIRK